MASLETIQIHDPKRPGRFVNINRDDFRPGQHRPFSEPLPEPLPEQEADATETAKRGRTAK